MKSDIIKLANIANKPTKRILGLMSGTSLDGLDIALCKITHHGKRTKLEVEKFKTVAYSQSQKALLSQHASVPKVDLRSLCQLHTWLGRLYADMISETLQLWQEEHQSIDLIASHGQTIYHCPGQPFYTASNLHSTLQIVDADVIATKTGIITISDFRQKHIANELEGAPLVQYGDHLLYSDKKVDRILLNIGGISNLTYLPKAKAINDTISSDVGPGNTLIDQYCQHTLGIAYDENGKVASRGNVNDKLLIKLSQHAFFDLPLPKSTGQELFNRAYIQSALSECDLCHEDIIATLTEFTARTIAEAINQLTTEHTELYVSGGGVHNAFLMQRLGGLLKATIEIKDFANLNIEPDAKEAALFALLANETLSGDKEALPFSMGKISLPS